mmetsp:Transcript_15282/g.25848  ORF Transcript_15282/g.25848 Transcript_15282/m.25848 type:complete len:83 (+) Transcript_15282:75-323(+)
MSLSQTLRFGERDAQENDETLLIMDDPPLNQKVSQNYLTQQSAHPSHKQPSFKGGVQEESNVFPKGTKDDPSYTSGKKLGSD